MNNASPIRDWLEYRLHPDGRHDKPYRLAKEELLMEHMGKVHQSMLAYTGDVTFSRFVEEEEKEMYTEIDGLRGVLYTIVSEFHEVQMTTPPGHTSVQDEPLESAFIGDAELDVLRSTAGKKPRKKKSTSK